MLKVTSLSALTVSTGPFLKLLVSVAVVAIKNLIQLQILTMWFEKNRDRRQTICVCISSYSTFLCNSGWQRIINLHTNDLKWKVGCAHTKKFFSLNIIPTHPSTPFLYMGENTHNNVFAMQSMPWEWRRLNNTQKSKFLSIFRHMKVMVYVQKKKKTAPDKDFYWYVFTTVDYSFRTIKVDFSPTAKML